MKLFKSEKDQHFQTSKKALKVQIYKFSGSVSLIITGDTNQLSEIQ